jgi:membrane associated rhomboid family serine protease
MDEPSELERDMRHLLRKRRLVIYLASAAVAGLVGIVFSAFYSPSASARQAPFVAAKTGLASEYHIRVNALPGSTPVGVAAGRAETVALKHTPGSPAGSIPAGVTATLVDATYAGGYARVAANGTRTPLVLNRPAWLVLIPNQQVPIFYPNGKSGPPSYTATMAALVDANSGHFILAATVASRY